MTTLNLTAAAPTKAQATLAELADEQSTKGAALAEHLRRVAEFDRDDVEIARELAEIRAALDHFPDDDDARNLNRRGRELEARKANNQSERATLQPEIDAGKAVMERLDDHIQVGQFNVDVENFGGLVQQAVSLFPATINALMALHDERERLQRIYPAHRFLRNGAHIPACAGTPAVRRAVVMEITERLNLLLASLAEWRPGLFPVGDPARVRAEHIATVEQHAAAAGDAVRRKQVEQLRETEARRAAAAAHPAPPPKPRDAVDLLRAADDAIRAARR